MTTAPPAESRFTQYEQYFASDALDIYSGRYAGILHHFRSQDNAPTSVDTLNLVKGFGSTYPFAFLAVLEDNGSQYFQVYHSPQTFPTMQPTPWNGRLFVTEGDVTMGNFITVELPDDAFAMANAGLDDNVPINFARARDIYTNNPDDEFVGPFADDAAQIKTTRTRHFMALPHKYVRLFIGGRVPIRKGFHDLSAALESNNDVDNCAPLVDWLLMAITRGGPGAATDLAVEPPAAVRADSALLTHRTRIVHDHLKGLSSGVSLTLAAAHQQLVQTVSQVVDEQRKTREEARDRATREKAKTVAKEFGKDVAETLCILCDVATDDLLPPVWKKFAETKQDRVALEMAVQTAARNHDRTRYAPVVTTELTKRVKSLNWVGADMDRLEDGIHPFNLLLVNKSGAHGHRAVAQALEYDMLMSGDASATLSDVKQLKAAKVIVPETFSMTKAVLYANMIVWITMVGEGHPFVQALGKFLDRFAEMEAELEDELALITHTGWINQPPSYAYLLRFVQVETHLYWWKALRSQTLPTAPNFTIMLDDIERKRSQWMPTFPLGYWKTPEGTPSLISSLTGGTEQSTGTEDKSKAGSEKKQESGTPVPNAKYNEVFRPFRAKIDSKVVLLRKIIKAKAPPGYERGGTSISQMCASYHIKGSCWSNCKHKVDHQEHTAEEDGKLLQWCQEQFPS